MSDRFLTVLRKKIEQQLKAAYDDREKLLDDLDRLKTVRHFHFMQNQGECLHMCRITPL